MDPPNTVSRIGISSYYLPCLRRLEDVETTKQLKARKTFSSWEKRKKESSPLLFSLRNLTVLGPKQCVFLILRHRHLHDLQAEVTKAYRHR